MKLSHPGEGVRVLCGLFGYTRQAFYKAKKRQELQEEKNQLILQKVRKIREAWVTDAFSRKIIGWHLHKNLAEGTLKALEMALKQKGDQPLSHPLIHYSDRGIQYCCHDYIRLLMKNGITISIRRGA